MKKILFLLASCVLNYGIAQAQHENTKITVGQKAPELAFKDPNGKEIKLSTINKKRIILIDFWASWCGPCRRANPRLVELYKRYSAKEYKNAKKGFEILSVSLDREKDPWVKAIEKDSLYWPNHMSDLVGWQSKAAQAYGVEFIPQAFLIDAEGNVLAKYNFAEQAEADLEKLMK
jgi:thiol-disulfide isomerase/thioredoxin